MPVDALALLNTSIPSYFVIGPLFVVLIILIALIGKKDKPAVPPVAQPQAPQVTTPPVAQVVADVPQVPSQPEPGAVNQSVASNEGWHSLPQQEVAQPVVQTTPTPTPTPVAEATPVTTESALPPITPNPLPPEEMPKQPELVINHLTPPPSPASIPPISSWKPSPTPSVSGEMLGVSEGTLQANALGQEATHPVAVESGSATPPQEPQHVEPQAAEATPAPQATIPQDSPSTATTPTV